VRVSVAFLSHAAFPFFSRVGIRIFTFEACSGFSRAAVAHAVGLDFRHFPLVQRKGAASVSRQPPS
jgi:hypothetical protein